MLALAVIDARRPGPLGGAMATRHRIDCIRKDDRLDPYERITDVGGPNPGGGRWEQSTAAAIVGIEEGAWSFYVERPVGDRVDVVVAVSRYGNQYLKTTADGDAPNNLLSLPECA